jgi:hypothetical protein
MAVTVTDVRIALNNIPPEDLADDAILQKISDAEAFASELGLSPGNKRDRFVRDWAAWRSFIISNTYSRIKLADITVQQEIRMRAAELKQAADDSLAMALAVVYTVSTPMFDDRPQDPYQN